MEVRAARGGHFRDRVGRHVASGEESCQQQRRRGIEAGRCRRDDHLDGRPSTLSRCGSGSEREASWDGTEVPVAVRASDQDQGAQTDGWERMKGSWKERGRLQVFMWWKKAARGGAQPRCRIRGDHTRRGKHRQSNN